MITLQAVADGAVPQELVHAVIGAIWTDSADDGDGAIECWRTLRSATLVCRSWHAVAQRRFDSLLPSMEVAEAWHEATTARGRLAARGPRVRVLYLDGFAPDGVSYIACRACVQACPNVTHVAAHWGDEWADELEDQIAPPEALRVLILRHADADTLVKLPDCALHRLDIADCNLDHPHGKISLPAAYRTHLRSLSLGLSQYLVQDSLKPMLSELGALRRLLISGIDGVELAEAFDGAHAAIINITSFVFRPLIDGTEAGDERAIFTAGLVCAALALPHLRQFSLEATMRHPSDLDPANFTRMVSALASVVTKRSRRRCARRARGEVFAARDRIDSAQSVHAALARRSLIRQ